jgi:hypothetical protein
MKICPMSTLSKKDVPSSDYVMQRVCEVMIPATPAAVAWDMFAANPLCVISVSST